MKVLGIETATAVCAAAIAVDGAVAAEESVEQDRVHAEKLLGIIGDAMASAAASLDDIDGVAVSIGPGSFTGLRIGLSVAKGIVYGRGLKLLAVPTLEGLAHAAVTSGVARPGTDVLAAIDARRDDVYCQLFTVDGGRCVPVWDARDLVLPELLHAVRDRRVTVTGDAVRKIAAYVGGQADGQGGNFTFLPPAQARCSAGSVAVLGTSRLAGGMIEDPSALEPRYIKEFFLKSR